MKAKVNFAFSTSTPEAGERIRHALTTLGDAINQIGDNMDTLSVARALATLLGKFVGDMPAEYRDRALERLFEEAQRIIAEMEAEGEGVAGRALADAPTLPN